MGGSFFIAVDDYDKALKWYTEKLGFEVRVRKDNTFGEGYRFLTVGAKQQQDHSNYPYGG